MANLSALIECNNSITSVVNTFNNTFENLVKNMKANMLAISDKVKVDGPYATFALAKADIPNEMTTQNATIATQTFTKGEELFVTLNGYNEAGTIAQRAAAVEAIMVKVAEIAPLVARV